MPTIDELYGVEMARLKQEAHRLNGGPCPGADPDTIRGSYDLRICGAPSLEALRAIIAELKGES